MGIVIVKRHELCESLKELSTMDIGIQLSRELRERLYTLGR